MRKPPCIAVVFDFSRTERQSRLTTVILQVAVLPFEVFAVIVAVPDFFAVTTPFVLTEATALLLVLHVTVLSVAFDGVIVAFSVSVSPANSIDEV